MSLGAGQFQINDSFEAVPYDCLSLLEPQICSGSGPSKQALNSKKYLEVYVSLLT
ncbi:hypothetical protein AEP_01731 [Curvibacter sp. AEP1-3]|nr:hypothetical protein AEP_01731 [Curvibacter sp. AEP1-3]